MFAMVHIIFSHLPYQRKRNRTALERNDESALLADFRPAVNLLPIAFLYDCARPSANEVPRNDLPLKSTIFPILLILLDHHLTISRVFDSHFLLCA